MPGIIIQNKTEGTNILLVRPAYSYIIVLVALIVFVLKALINLQNISQAMT